MTIKRIANIPKSRSRKAEMIRFVLTGGIATILQYSLYLIFVGLIGLKAELSAVISYGLSFIANFFLSNLFTFKTRPNKRKAASFAISHLINLGLQTLLVAIFSRLISAEYALIPAMLICIPVNFFLVRFSLTSKLVSK